MLASRRQLIGLILLATSLMGWVQLDEQPPAATVETAPDLSETQAVALRRIPWPPRSTPTTVRPTTTTTRPTTTTTPRPTTTTTARPTTTTTARPTTTTAVRPTTTTTTTARPVATTIAPPPPVTGGPGAAVLNELLALVNAVRATGTTCGGRAYPAVPPLAIQGNITQAAQAHAADMAAYDYFSHTGRNGSDPGNRMTAAGYNWSAWSENIAAGQGSPSAVVAGWFGSPGHCTNFMSGTVTQIGFGMVTNPSSTYRIYWVADMGRPR